MGSSCPTVAIVRQPGLLIRFVSPTGPLNLILRGRQVENLPYLRVRDGVAWGHLGRAGLRTTNLHLNTTIRRYNSTIKYMQVFFEPLFMST